MDTIYSTNIKSKKGNLTLAKKLTGILAIAFAIAGFSLTPIHKQMQAAQLWTAVFTYDLPAGTLSEGEYDYRFEFTWNVPEPGGVITPPGAVGEFVVASEPPLYEGYALLRGFTEWGRRVQPGGPVCEDINTIHPQQPTRFIKGWITDQEMTYQEARAHFKSMTARVFWDDESAVLVRHEIKPFSAVDVDKYVCSFALRK